jgi:hypothetical protein
VGNGGVSPLSGSGLESIYGYALFQQQTDGGFLVSEMNATTNAPASTFTIP